MLLIFVPLGLVMIFKPKPMWWALSSWKFKNPEANEPSEAGYLMTRLSGIMTIGVAIFLVMLTARTPSQRFAPPVRSTTPTSPTATKTYAPQDRGEIPIVGYQLMATNKGKQYLTISYLTPQDADAVAGGMNTAPNRGCEVVQTVNGIGTGTVTVDLRLSWSNPNGYYTARDDERCRVTGRWSPYGASTMVSTEIDPAASVFTNGDIVNYEGQVVAKAAAGNAVPKLAGTP